MKLLRNILASAIVLSALSCGEVFADVQVPASEAAKETQTGSGGEIIATAQEEASTGEVAPQDVEKEKQKAMDDVNAFLIESYKIKLDKLLDEVYRSVRVAAKDDPALQTLLLKRVLGEIENKMDSIAVRKISPNRKKILLAVFAYLRTDVQAKIKSLETK